MFPDVDAVLIDLDGVLYVEEKPIVGAVDAVERLRRSGLALRFVTNTTAHSRDRTLDKLACLGFSVAGWSPLPRSPSGIVSSEAKSASH